MRWRGVRELLEDAERALRDGDLDAAARALDRATDACDDLPPSAPERAEIEVGWATISKRDNDAEGAFRHLLEAVRLDREAGRADALAGARCVRAAEAALLAHSRRNADALLDQAFDLPLDAEQDARARHLRARLHPRDSGGALSAAAADADVATTSTPAVTPLPAESLEVLLAELDALVGLGEVKAAVHELVALARLSSARRDAGLPSPAHTHHLAMVGAPGTGKTTVARLLGRIYHALGIIGRGHFVEVTRADLVAGFVGQTAKQTNDVCDRAAGGVLFIDEAYSLAGGGERDFGGEALAELVKRMEDDRDNLVVILAGYPREMERLLDANSGLRSRLQRTLTFADYGPPELASIFDDMAETHRWELTPAAREAAHVALAARHSARAPGWANARSVRVFFEGCIARHATRALEDGTITPDELTTLDVADVSA